MPKLSYFMKHSARIAITLAAVAAAAILASTLWHAYVVAPWTRDGRVSAQVVRIAPEVSGTVQEVAVTDNQYVRRGEVLYRIDPARFQLAVAQGEAKLAAASAILRQKTRDARRRQDLDDLIPGEEIQQAHQAVAVAQAEQQQAKIALDGARLDLERTVLHATVDGYVTHLRLNPGDYAVAGQANIALLDADSFWVTGYFEETKLPGITLGAQAQIRLMGHDDVITGQVASIGRGITDSNQLADPQGLPSVAPNFSWVRLAQRIPVHIQLDTVPAGMVLVAGTTCSIEISQGTQRASPQGRLSNLLQRWL